MRHIQIPDENEAPSIFKRWVRSHPNAKYSRLKDSHAKKAVKEALIVRQKFLCCYCESRISAENSHIEHIEPQMGGLSEKTLKFSNMAASCIREPKNSGARLPEVLTMEDINSSAIHCGHARGSARVVSPYDPKCETLFVYSFSGEVRPNPDLDSSDDKLLAEESILHLRLNVATLVELRKTAMYETVSLLDKGVPEDIILSEIRGKLPPYYSAAKSAIRVWNSAGKRGRRDS